MGAHWTCGTCDVAFEVTRPSNALLGHNDPGIKTESNKERNQESNDAGIPACANRAARIPSKLDGSIPQVTATMAGMSRGEELEKRWKMSIRDLLTFVGIVSFAFGTMRFGVLADSLAILAVGLFIIAGSVGALIGKILVGTSRAVLIGFCYGCWAFCVLVFLLVVVVPGPE